MSQDRSSQDHEDLQRAFEREASELDVSLEHRSFAEGEHHGIGIIPLMGRAPLAQVEAAATAQAAAGADEAEIGKLLTGWESVDPERCDAQIPPLVTDPFVAVGEGRIDVVDGAAIRGVRQTELYRRTRERFPAYQPRRVALSRLEIVHLGSARAAATYQVQEEFTNGHVFTGNAAALLFRTTAGWRIAVVSKHQRAGDLPA